MALTKCKECGAEISTKAKVCPSCGAKVKGRSKLGRFIAVIIILVGIIWAISDGVSGSESSGSDNITAKVNETIKTDDFEITVTSVKKLKWVGNDFLSSEPSEGGIFVGIQYKYKNISDEPMGMFDTPDFILLDSNNVEYKPDINASMSYTSQLEIDEKAFSQLNPGISVTGADVFEVAKDLLNKGEWRIKISADKKIFVPIKL